MSKCSGVLFRGVQSQYFDKKTVSFKYQESFKLLKRSSCDCKECKYIIKCLENDGDNMIDCTYWFKTFNHEPIDNGATYQLKVESWESDWEESDWSAYPEEVKMIKVK